MLFEFILKSCGVRRYGVRSKEIKSKEIKSKEIWSKELSQMHRLSKPLSLFPLFILSAFHLSIISLLKAIFTLSPFHLLTFKSLFTFKSSYHTFTSSQNTHPPSAPCLALRRT